VSTITSRQVNELTRLAVRLAYKLRKMERSINPHQADGPAILDVLSMFAQGVKMTNALMIQPQPKDLQLVRADFEAAIQRTIAAIKDEQNMLDGGESRRAVEYDARWLAKLQEELAR